MYRGLVFIGRFVKLWLLRRNYPNILRMNYLYVIPVCQMTTDMFQLSKTQSCTLFLECYLPNDTYNRVCKYMSNTTGVADWARSAYINGTPVLIQVWGGLVAQSLVYIFCFVYCCFYLDIVCLFLIFGFEYH